MIDNGMKLVQQIDALTYNSRQVLNALIRSCMQTGSSSGYTVKRGTTTLVLDRNAIYKLYDFYQRWEKVDFDEDSFETLLSQCDAMWGGTGNSVTKAVATHSQICFLGASDTGISTADMDSASSTDLLAWCQKVKTVNNKKGTVNSAPIPLNLRTPLYDENLSTKSFSQYETYLFPMEYYAANMLGAYGDGQSYTAGGENWSIETNDTIKLYGNHVVIGDVDTGAALSTGRKMNYTDSHFTLSAGHNSFAFGDYAAAFGERTVAYGDRSVSTGEQNVAYGSQAIVGGSGNYASGYDSVVFGENNWGIGANSLTAGSRSSAGDLVYAFTLTTKTNTYETSDCSTVVNADGQCVTRTTKTIDTVYGLTIDEYPTVRITAGDMVKVMYQYRSDSYPVSDDGYVYKEMIATVTKVTYSAADNNCFVELSESIPVEENGVGIVVGGYVTRYRHTIGDLNYTTGGVRGDQVDIWSGNGSVAVNSYVYAAGMNQTVVGAGNSGNFDARFIVGTGEAKLGGDRFNGLVVAPGYSVMSDRGGYVAVSVSEGTGLWVTKTYRDLDPTVCNGAALSADRYVESDANKYFQRSVVNAFRGGVAMMSMQGLAGESPAYTSMITMCGTGDNFRYIDQNMDISVAVESYDGTLIVSSGPSSYVSVDGTKRSFTNYMMTRSDGLLYNNYTGAAADGNMGVYAQNLLEIAAQNETGTSVVSVNSCGYIQMHFKYISLDGATYGFLPTTDKSRSHSIEFYGIDDDYDNLWHPDHSGFYHAEEIVFTDATSGIWYDGPGQVIASCAQVGYNETTNVATYATAGLAIPDYLDDSTRPMIWMYGGETSNKTTTKKSVTRALAYYSDVQSLTSGYDTRITALESKTSSINGLVLAGIHLISSDYDSSTGKAKDSALFYFASNKVSMAAGIGYGMPTVFGWSNSVTTNGMLYPYCNASVSNSISADAEYHYYDSTAKAYKKMISQVWSTMDGYYLTLSFNVVLPTNVKSIKTIMMLGGGIYVMKNDLYSWGLTGYSYSHTTTTSGLENYTVDIQYSQTIPGALIITITNCNSAGSTGILTSAINANVLINHIMTPIRIASSTANASYSNYIIPGHAGTDATLAAASYNGKQYGLVNIY